MSEIDEYLNVVAGQIRVKRIREPLTRELRQHIEDSQSWYQSEGIAQSEAIRLAIEDMGDALLVGGELDRVHRPRFQWTGLLTALFLIALGLAVQTFLYGFGLTDIAGDLRLPASLGAAGLIALFALSDYTWWVKLSIPLAVAWVLLCILRMDGAFNYATTYALGLLGFVRMYYVQLPFLYVVPQIICTASAMVLALVVCAMRGRKWGAFGFCALLCLLPMALALCYRGTGYDPNATLLMSLLCPVMIAIALRKRFFNINRKAAYAILAGLSIYPLWAFVHDFIRIISIRQGYIEEVARPLVRSARLIGPGMANIYADYINNKLFLAGAIHLFGWLPFILFTSGVSALFARCFKRFITMSNRMGSLIGISATLILAARTALFYLASFTNYSVELSLPLISRGNAMLLVDAILVGVILSCLRAYNLPEALPKIAPRAMA